MMPGDKVVRSQLVIGYQQLRFTAFVINDGGEAIFVTAIDTFPILQLGTRRFGLGVLGW